MGTTETFPDHLVPVFDLRFTDEDLEAVAETLRSGWLTMGPRTQEFEAAFAETIGARHAVAVSSCTGALHLAYLAAGIGPGDEVIVPSCTMVATAAAVLYTGATPVFADIISVAEPLIDPDHVEALITNRTKAVVAMHYGGYGAAVDRLAQICDARGIVLIEDAAHSPLATVGGRALGTWGLAGAFSFFSNKVLAVSEGGLLATDDDDVAAFARSRRGHAMTTVTWDRHQAGRAHYDVTGLGFNYRIDDPRSALLLSRLRRLESDIERRRELTARYRSLLAEVDGLTVAFSDESVETSSCYIMAVMLDRPETQGPVRLALREKHGIQTSLFYPAIHEFSAYRERFGTISLPHSELLARSQVTLPFFPHMSDAQMDRVIEALSIELGA
jgi:dTDP-4-amino-4,6-dideoxygalactose transaminase